MSDLGKSPELESRIEPFTLIDRDDLVDSLEKKREALRQNVSVAIGIVGGLAAIIGLSTLGGYIVQSGKRVQEQSKMSDEAGERSLESFGTQGRVAQIHGERFDRFFQCVLENDIGEKVLARYYNLPVVEGEIWEVEYDALHDCNVVTREIANE